MFCTKCGTKIEEGKRFCSGCGNPLFGSVTNDVRAGNHEKADLGLKTMEEIAKNDKAVTPPQQTEPPSPATRYVSPPRNNLLIALIILSAVTIVVFALTLFYFNFYLQNWFIRILVTIAMVNGYIYHSSVLKISAYIGLVLLGRDFFIDLSVMIMMKDKVFYLLRYNPFCVLCIILSVVFLVSAIQLLIKTTVSGK